VARPWSAGFALASGAGNWRLLSLEELAFYDPAQLAGVNPARGPAACIAGLKLPS